METYVQKSLSLVLGVGSILFLIAAFLPYSKMFAESDPAKKMQIILDMHGMFNVAHVLFGLGSIITVIGLGLIIKHFKEIQGYNIAFAAVLLMFAGALLWTWHTTERIIDPEGFVYGKNTPYLFAIYSVFTQAGLFIIGLFLLKTVVPGWIGWLFVIGSATIFVLMIIFKDMPPFVYYVLTLIAAFTLFFSNKAII